jgi:hypothetical protein
MAWVDIAGRGRSGTQRPATGQSADATGHRCSGYHAAAAARTDADRPRAGFSPGGSPGTNRRRHAEPRTGGVRRPGRQRPCLGAQPGPAVLHLARRPGGQPAGARSARRRQSRRAGADAARTTSMRTDSIPP